MPNIYIHQCSKEYIISNEAEIMIDKYGISMKQLGYYLEGVTRQNFLSSFFTYKQENALLYFTLSEFPGNCSAVILQNVQAYTGKLRELFSVFFIAFATASYLEYKFLFVSSSYSDFTRLLETSFNFTEVCSGTNPHSGNFNTFFVMDLKSDVFETTMNHIVEFLKG